MKKAIYLETVVYMKYPDTYTTFPKYVIPLC